MSALSALSPASACIAIGGTRHASAPAAELAAAVARLLASRGHPLAVGCCVGVDAAVLRSLAGSPLMQRVQVFAQFGPPSQHPGCPPPRGIFPLSAWQLVQGARAGGAAVRYWAGGPESVPLHVRLVKRTAAVAAAGLAGAVVIASGSLGAGSLALVRHAQSAGRPVWVLHTGSPAAVQGSLPPGSGQWAPLSSGPLATFPGFQWQPAQAGLGL
jgi:hypothetical protein